MIKRTVTTNIQDQVIDECVNRRLKVKSLEKGTLTVVQLQEIARAHEAAQCQVKNMEQNSGPGLDSGGEPVGAVSGRNPKKTARGSTPKQPGKQLCFRCGKAGHYAKGPKCPAKEKKCDLCSKNGHFWVVCRSKGASQKDRLNVVDVDDDDEFAFGVTGKKKPELVNIVVGVVEIIAMIDSGASCNIVDKNTCGEMKKEKIQCTSSKATGDVCMPLGMKNH